MNSTDEPSTVDSDLVPADPERRALEARIEMAKARLFEDLNQVSTMAKQTAKQAAGVASRGLLRVALVGGLLVIGLAAAFIHRRRRLRVVWK